MNMRSSDKVKLPLIILLVTSLFAHTSAGQKIDTVSAFTITGYIDAYYAYYSDSVGPGNFQKFPTVSPRSNSPGLNIAQLSMSYTTDKVRAMGAFHYGDIPASTWPTPFRNIQEAHAGVKVINKLWIDAGFFRSYFGTELLTPAENITSSVTVGTFHEPYYESGIRLSFDATSKLAISVFLLNGYNVFVDNNNKKSTGVAISYAINSNTGIAYTNYIGDDSSPLDSVAHLRIHQNAYINYAHNKIKLQVGGDFCLQKNSDLATGKQTASMFSGLATVRYQCTRKLGIYARGEIFSDPDGYMGMLITDELGKRTGLKLWGATAGAEYKPTAESYVKLEGRLLQMDEDQKIFHNDGKPQNSRFEIMINAGVTFELLKKFGTRTAE